MKKILVAVDDTKGTKSAVATFTHVCKCLDPEVVILLHVEKLEGKSLIDEMLGEPEMSTLQEVLKGTEYQEALDRKAKKILEYYQKTLAESGVSNIKTVVKTGHPAEEILKAAEEENTDLIIVGSRGKRTSHLFMGSVSREVANGAGAPVLIVKVK